MNSHLNCWFAAAIVGLFSTFAAQAADLIVNGGFEVPPLPVVGGYVHRNENELTGWVLFSSRAGIVHFNTDYRPVSEGAQAIQIEHPGDWISQRFATIKGQEYLLSFDLSAYSSSSPGITNVTVGPAFGTYTGTADEYVTYTLPFIADSTQTTVAFEDAGGVGRYPHLDNVSVIGPPVTPVSIDIEPDGTEQECSEQGGTTVQLTAEVDGANFTSFLWTIDGEDAGSTKTIPAFLELGQHSVRVDVMADNGATASSTENVIVEDTTAPVINAAFLNSKTGTEITVINSKDQADISISVSDLCDGTPSSSATAGLPVFDGNTISAKTSNKDSSVKLSIEGNADNVELMVTAEDASGNKSNAKTTLIVAQ